MVKCEKSSNKCPDTCKHKEWHEIRGIHYLYSLSCDLKCCSLDYLCPTCREEGEAKTPFFIDEIVKLEIIDEEEIFNELNEEIKEREKYITNN